MATIPASAQTPFITLGQVVAQLPGIPLSRIRLSPRPGTATEADVIAVRSKDRSLCELVDGVLVEKAMGHNESVLAGYILTAINNYLEQNDIGRAAGEASMLRLAEGQVRMPDVSFVSRSQFASGEYPTEPIWAAYPDLAVEVISESNTQAEIVRKTREYFAAGSSLVWIVDPPSQSVTEWTSPSDSSLHRVGDVLGGGKVLPGFQLPVARIFRQRLGE